MPREPAVLANSSTLSGVRCADNACISKGTLSSFNTLAAPSITGRSEVLPIIILTFGFICSLFKFSKRANLIFILNFSFGFLGVSLRKLTMDERKNE
jgi:hypothetical protein